VLTHACACDTWRYASLFIRFMFVTFSRARARARTCRAYPAKGKISFYGKFYFIPRISSRTNSSERALVFYPKAAA